MAGCHPRLHSYPTAFQGAPLAELHAGQLGGALDQQVQFTAAALDVAGQAEGMVKAGLFLGGTGGRQGAEGFGGVNDVRIRHTYILITPFRRRRQDKKAGAGGFTTGVGIRLAAGEPNVEHDPRSSRKASSLS